MNIVGIKLGLGLMLVFALGLIWGLPRLQAANSVDELHRAFIAALEAGDQQEALALVSSEGQHDLASRLANFATIRQTGIVPLRGPNTLGPLIQVRALSVAEAESDHVGISIWSFQKRTLCYATRLDVSAGQWSVRDWSRIACPSSTP